MQSFEGQEFEIIMEERSSSDEVLEAAESLLRRVDIAKQLHVVTELLARWSSDTFASDENGVSRALRIIKTYCQANEDVARLLLEFIEICEFPQRVIDVLPEVAFGDENGRDAFISQNAQVMGQDEKSLGETMMNTLKQLLKEDRTLLVPIIGAMSSLKHMGEGHQNQIIDLCKESLVIVDVDDLPAVVRTLMSSTSRKNGFLNLYFIRYYCKDIQLSVLSLVADVLVQSMMDISKKAVLHAFFAIMREFHRMERIDFIVLIMLCSKRYHRVTAAKFLLECVEAHYVLPDLFVQLCKEKGFKDVISPFQQGFTFFLAHLLLCSDSISSSDLTSRLQFASSYFSQLFDLDCDKNELVRLLITSCCTAHSTNGYRIALMASELLLRLSRRVGHELRSYVAYIEEIVQKRNDLPSVLLHRLSSTVCSLQDSSIATTALIFIQKSLVQFDSSAKICGLILAQHCLQVMLHDREDADSDEVISWVLRLLDEGCRNQMLGVAVLDVFSFNCSSMLVSDCKFIYSSLQNVFQDSGIIIQNDGGCIIDLEAYMESAFNRASGRQPFFLFKLIEAIITLSDILYTSEDTDDCKLQPLSSSKWASSSIRVPKAFMAESDFSEHAFWCSLNVFNVTGALLHHSSSQLSGHLISLNLRARNQMSAIGQKISEGALVKTLLNNAVDGLNGSACETIASSMPTIPLELVVSFLCNHVAETIPIFELHSLLGMLEEFIFPMKAGNRPNSAMHEFHSGIGATLFIELDSTVRYLSSSGFLSWMLSSIYKMFFRSLEDGSLDISLSALTRFLNNLIYHTSNASIYDDLMQMLNQTVCNLDPSTTSIFELFQYFASNATESAFAVLCLHICSSTATNTSQLYSLGHSMVLRVSKICQRNAGEPDCTDLLLRLRQLDLIPNTLLWKSLSSFSMLRQIGDGISGLLALLERRARCKADYGLSQFFRFMVQCAPADVYNPFVMVLVKSMIELVASEKTRHDDVVFLIDETLPWIYELAFLISMTMLCRFNVTHLSDAEGRHPLLHFINILAVLRKLCTLLIGSSDARVLLLPVDGNLLRFFPSLLSAIQIKMSELVAMTTSAQIDLTCTSLQLPLTLCLNLATVIENVVEIHLQIRSEGEDAGIAKSFLKNVSSGCPKTKIALTEFIDFVHNTARTYSLEALPESTEMIRFLKKFDKGLSRSSMESIVLKNSSDTITPLEYYSTFKPVTHSLQPVTERKRQRNEEESFDESGTESEGEQENGFTAVFTA